MARNQLIEMAGFPVDLMKEHRNTGRKQSRIYGFERPKMGT